MDPVYWAVVWVVWLTIMWALVFDNADIKRLEKEEKEKMASYNDITGNCLVTKPSTDAYRAGYDAIFGKKKVEQAAPIETTAEEDAAFAALAESTRKEDAE